MPTERNNDKIEESPDNRNSPSQWSFFEPQELAVLPGAVLMIWNLSLITKGIKSLTPCKGFQNFRLCLLSMASDLNKYHIHQYVSSYREGLTLVEIQFHLQKGTFAEAMGFCLFKHPERIFGLKPGSDADDVDTWLQSNQSFPLQKKSIWQAYHWKRKQAETLARCHTDGSHVLSEAIWLICSSVAPGCVYRWSIGDEPLALSLGQLWLPTGAREDANHSAATKITQLQYILVWAAAAEMTWFAWLYVALRCLPFESSAYRGLNCASLSLKQKNKKIKSGWSKHGASTPND